MTGPETQQPEDGENDHDLAHSLSTTAKKAAAKGIHMAGERLAHALEGGEHDAKPGAEPSGSRASEGALSRPSDPPASSGPRQTGRLALLGGVIAGVLTLFGVVAQASATTKSIGLLTVIVAAAFALVSIWLAFSFFDARRERERIRSRAESRRSGTSLSKVPVRKAVTTSSPDKRRPDRDTEPRARIRSYIQEIEQGYQDGRGSRREWLVTAPLGYGKTSLQRALKSWAKARGMVPIWVTVSAEAPGAPWHVRCQLRVSTIAKDLGEVDEKLGLRLNRAILVARTRCEEEDAVGPAMAELSETVSSALISAGTTAFLVDDMHHLNEAEAAWLLDLGRTLIAGSKALVVYASQEPALLVDGRAAVGNPMALATISAAHSRDEAAWWMDGAPKKISHRHLTPIADQVLAETAGLCFIFDWRCQDVADHGPDVLKIPVTEAAAGLSGVAAQAAAAALAALDREAARVAGVDRLPLSDWLAVLDRFGGSLRTILNEILEEEEGLSKQQAADVAAWLAAGRLEIQAFDDDENLGLRLIPFLQEYRRGVLRSQEEPRLRHLRALAERHYWRYIDSDFTEPAPTQLTEMVRFETPEWHMLTMEWLDHAQAAGAEVERDVTLSCMQLFLTCYTWWDCFVHYPYCTQLLKEFERRWPQAEWVKDFRRFREAFPSGSYTPHARPSIDVARWARTEEILDDLVGKLDLVHGEPQTPATRRVYGLLAQQYAHVYLFQGFPDESLTWLERARENDPEDWQIPWLEYRMAEAHYAAGRYDEARRLADKVEVDVREMKDNDLTILIAQIQSDLAWQARDTERSLTYLVRAVIWAHAYHLQQETDGSGKNPSTPNAYTQARQEEAHQRLTARLGQLDRVAKADWTARIATVFEPYWRRVERIRPGKGRGKGLPPRPTWEDIRDGTSGEYFKDVRKLYFTEQSSARSMAQRLKEPLDAALP